MRVLFHRGISLLYDDDLISFFVTKEYRKKFRNMNGNSIAGENLHIF